MADKGRRLDHFVAMAIGEPVDLGWGVAVLHPNHTVTRTCKYCGVSVTSGANLSTGVVERVDVHHAHGCAFLAGLGNNPELS